MGKPLPKLTGMLRPPSDLDSTTLAITGRRPYKLLRCGGQWGFIAARGLAALLGYIKPTFGVGAATGRRSGAAMRMPVVLADIWALARTSGAAQPTSTSVRLQKDSPTRAPASA